MNDRVLDDLREEFREMARVRVHDMAALLERLEREPEHGPALRQMGKHVHALAGMGGTYGFTRVSQLGDEAEAAILPLLRSGGAPDPATIARWREIVREMQGELELEPEAVALPARPRAYRVLIIEEDADLASRIAAALEREEMTVCICRPGEAGAQLEADLPDAAIVDAGSFDVLLALHARSGGESMDAIVTGDTAFADKVRAIRSGADAFIGKPLDVTALVRRVAALRERKERPSRRILAVEDDATTGALLRGILGAAGYAVEICRDAAEFEKTLFAFEPDLLLMDVQLSAEVSGHDLIRYVRQSERFSTLPVIIVTSDSERRAILEGTSAGADMLVAKPVDWDLLLSQIAARLERAAAMREITDRDPLTGVLTRGAFDARVRQRRHSGRAAVLALLDLDHFKTINDTHGHVAGDRVLAAFGTLLRRRLRQTDVVARYGGEEFALLLEGASVRDAVQLCERLLEEFRSADGVTFSAGLAALHDSFDEAFRRADAALYEAKRAGRARIVPAE